MDFRKLHLGENVIRKVILDSHHREVQPSRFFTDLRADNLSQVRLRGWITELVLLRVYVFVVELVIHPQWILIFEWDLSIRR